SALVGGHTALGPAVGPVVLRNSRPVFQGQKGLELADDLSARGVRMESLPDHAPEGAPAGVDAVTAVLVALRFWEEFGGDPATQARLQLRQGVGADQVDHLGGARAHGS